MLGLNLDEMAERIQTGQKRLSGYENGLEEPKASTILYYVGEGFSPEWLLLGVGDPYYKIDFFSDYPTSAAST